MITRLQHHAVRNVMGNYDFIHFRGAKSMENIGCYSFDNIKVYLTVLRLSNDLNATSDAHLANTRASNNGNILGPMPHVERFRHSLKYRGAVLRNTLPHVYAKHRALMNLNEDIWNIISPKEIDFRL